MVTCIKPDLAPSSAYRYYKCRCLRCQAWKKEAAARTNDKELAKQRSKEWRIKYPERSRQNAINYQKKHPEQVFKWQCKHYGITPEIFAQLHKAQQGRCAVCGGMPSGMQNGKSRLSIDHSSISGKVRGLLCGSCNVGLGHLKHSIAILQSGIQYLMSTNGDVYD